MTLRDRQTPRGNLSEHRIILPNWFIKIRRIGIDRAKMGKNPGNIDIG